jgi:NDP-sugar pyrophosphorylase family protein
MMTKLDRGAGELLRMAAVAVQDRSRFGGVVSDAEGRIESFLEKGQSGSGLINAGLYRLCRGALPAARAGAYSLERDVLPVLVQGRNAVLKKIYGSFIDIGVPDDYRRFCAQHAA